MNNAPTFADAVVYGHYHVPVIEKQNQKIFINPGSIALPRDGAKNSYAIIDENNIIIKDIEGNIIKSIKY